MAFFKNLEPFKISSPQITGETNPGGAHCSYQVCSAAQWPNCLLKKNYSSGYLDEMFGHKSLG